MRFGILPLRLETGRFVGEDEVDRICLFCNTNSIENEIHFCFHCEQYSAYKLKWLSHDATNHIVSDIEKLKTMWENYPRQLAKFIVAAFSTRKKLLYK